MPVTSKDTAEAQDFGIAVDRSAHLDDLTVNFVAVHETMDSEDMLVALPNGQCSCPHWGYVFAGDDRCDYGDQEEVYEAGDALHDAAGDVPAAEAGSEFVQFSPKEQLAATMDAIRAGMQAHA